MTAADAYASRSLGNTQNAGEDGRPISLPSIRQMFPDFLTDMRPSASVQHHPYRRTQEDVNMLRPEQRSAPLRRSPMSAERVRQLPVVQRTALDDILPRCVSSASNHKIYPQRKTPVSSRPVLSRHITDPEHSHSHSPLPPSIEPVTAVPNFSFDVLRSDPSDPTTLEHISSSAVFSPNDDLHLLGYGNDKSSPERIAKGSAPIFKVNALPARALPFPQYSSTVVDTRKDIIRSRIVVHNPVPTFGDGYNTSGRGRIGLDDMETDEVHQEEGGGSSDAEGDQDDMNNDLCSGKRHVCPHCDKRFNRPSSLKIHIHSHTGSMPFLCPWPSCNRRFNVNSNMRRHYRNHTELGLGYPDESRFNPSPISSGRSSGSNSASVSPDRSNPSSPGTLTSCSTSSLGSSSSHSLDVPEISRYYAQSDVRSQAKRFIPVKDEPIDVDLLP